MQDSPLPDTQVAQAARLTGMGALPATPSAASIPGSLHAPVPSVDKAAMPRGYGVEWQTWLLIVAVYASWVALILGYRAMPASVSSALLIVVTSWYMSLQHELLHGHPTRSRSLNRLLGLLPISAWYPYDVYRDSHLAHHRDELLTTPGVDPEGNYVLAQDYANMSPTQRAPGWANRTVAGRLLLGPGLTIVQVWSDIFTGPRKRGLASVRMWSLHLILLIALLWWVHHQSGIKPLHYLFGVAYPALALAMLRSFYEHRPAFVPAHRIVINEASLPWRLLYLNNNYHAVHHEIPSLPWYRIPSAFRADREGFLQRNGGFRLPGYGHVLRHHVFKPIDSPVHPGFDAPTTYV